MSVARADIPAIASVAAAIVAALLVLLVALGVSRRRRGASAPAAGGATVASPAAQNGGSALPLAPAAASADDPIEAEFLATLARTPSSKRALMGLAAHYAERNNVKGFDEIAQRIYRLSGGRGPNWVHVASIGRQLDPDNPMFALEAGETDDAVSTGEPDADVTTAPAVEVGREHAHPAEPAPTPESAAPPVVEVPPLAPPAVPTTPPAEPEPPVESRPSVEATSPEAKQSEQAGAPDLEATLPPGAIAALGGLDMGLPPRIEPHEGGAHPVAEAHEHEAQGESQGQEAALRAEPSHDAEPARADDGAARETGRHAREAPPRPAATPGVAGLGAAPIGPLALSFDLDLPGHESEEREGAPAALAPPQFTPEQLVRIARNKLDLAGEYIALGDLGGARTLIHEVIESNDAGTRDEAQALLATLAPLS